MRRFIFSHFKITTVSLITVTILLHLLFSQQPRIQEAEEKEFFLQEIEVKEGQTLSYIANYYLKDPKQWPEILKYNKLSTSDIYAPLPGMKLKVPIFIVKEKFRPAYLIYMLNNVKYRKRGTVVWEEPKINMELYNDDAITTYENSRANIKFYSGELLLIDENSFVTIRPELKQEEITLHKGGVRASKAKIITETAEVLPKIDPKLPKTDFRTKIREEDKATLVEVYEGAVDVTAQGKTVYVPKGFGTEVKPLSPPSPPKPLPPPPEVTLNPKDVKLSPENEVVLSKSFTTISLKLQEPKLEQKEMMPFISDIKPTTARDVSPIPPREQQKPKVLGSIIKKYRIQVAKDKEFKSVVYDKTNNIPPDGNINFDIAQLQLPDGRYYYKISYIDELGLENSTAPQTFIIDTTPPKVETNLTQISKTDEEILHASGKTEPDTFLTVNNKRIEVDKNGHFSFAEVLKPGHNKFILVAKDKFDNETIVEHVVERVYKLTKEEKTKQEQEKEKVKKSSSGLLATIVASVITSAVITLVLFFFLR